MITSSTEFEGGGDNLFAEGGDVIFVGVPDLLDQSMGAESFEQA
jgi:hypothetical protein